jgi:CubicO group peptidase (beta-lactamase class C family)
MDSNMKTKALRVIQFLALLSITTTLTGSTLFAQTRAEGTATPAPAGDLARQADDFLAQWDKNDMPGCSVGAIKDGQFVYKRGFGMANLDYDVPNTTTTRFNVASVSKAFTAMAVALLAEQGKLSLDDDIRKYVPELQQYKDTVTIRHLLHHTSGIREYEALFMFSGRSTDNVLSQKALLEMLARQKNTSFKPGSKYQYSNSNFQLAGIIVARVSGKSLRQFADENIFKPLGMKNTMFWDDRFEVVKNRAQGYFFTQDKTIRARSSLFNLVGGGGILTTVEDLYLWDQNFQNPKVGSKETIAMMTTPGKLNNGEKVNYGLGIFLGSYKGLPSFKHSGNMSGYRAQTISFPEQKFTAIALCNNMAILPQQIIEKLSDIYLEGQFKPAAPAVEKKVAFTVPASVPLTEAESLRYAGMYAHQESGQVFRLVVKDGKLTNSEFFKKELPVTKISEGKLLISDGNGSTELLPTLDKSGAVAEIRILAKDGTPEIYRPMKPPVDTPEKFAEYAGTYYSEELDGQLSFSAQGKSLTFHVNENLNPTVTPVYLDFFNTANGQIRLSFTRDEKGKVDGFIFYSNLDGREVNGVVFKRR